MSATRCVTCGRAIIAQGDRWMHVGAKPRRVLVRCDRARHDGEKRVWNHALRAWVLAT